MKDSALIVNSYEPPRFDIVRWTPLRYREVLPMQVMRQYRCVVVGASRGVLTVAFDERPGSRVVEGLRNLTGRTIFPVQVRPARMNLLLKRIDFWHNCHVSRNHQYYLHRYPIHALLELLPFNKVDDSDSDGSTGNDDR